MHVFCQGNESVKSINLGMKPENGDAILAAAGNGDQAFSLAEKAGRVVLIDNDPAQLEYARSRYEALRAGDFDGFLSNSSGTNRRYFRRFGRLNRIRRNLGRIEFLEPSDIFDNLADFPKVYMSNILGFGVYDTAGDFSGTYTERMDRLAGLTSGGTVVYVTDYGNRFMDYPIRGFRGQIKYLPDRFLPQPWTICEDGAFALDVSASRMARLYENLWLPAVLARR